MPTPRTKLGTWGESLACRFLRDKGYRIVASNYRNRHGEVDIVAEDGEELVFVEVRTRRPGSYGAPEESLSPSKVRRLLNTCQGYLQEAERDEAGWRVDLVCIHLGRGGRVRDVQHLTHAIEV
jgi:putative endonuclease